MLVILKSYGTYCKVPSCLMFTSPSHTWKRVFCSLSLGSNASPYPSCHCFAVYTLVPSCIVFRTVCASWQALNRCFFCPQCRVSRTLYLAYMYMIVFLPFSAYKVFMLCAKKGVKSGMCACSKTYCCATL